MVAGSNPAGPTVSPLFGEALLLQPECAVARPRVKLLGVECLAAEADSVAALFVKVQVESHALRAERGGEGEGVFHGDTFVFHGLPDEALRRVFAHVQPGREQLLLRVRAICAEKALLALRIGFVEEDEGVAEDREIGARTRPFDRVRGVGLARVELGDEHGREMAARGGADEPDAFRIETPFLGVGPHQTHGARGVQKDRRHAVAVARQPVLEDEGGDAQRIQPAGVDVALMGGEVRVAAARADHKNGARGFVGIRPERRERRNIFVGLAKRAGRVAGPETERGGRTVRGDGRKREGEKSENREEEEAHGRNVRGSPPEAQAGIGVRTGRNEG